MDWRERITAASVLVLGCACGGSAMGAGQAVGVKHPVLDHGVDVKKAAAYKDAVARVMAMGEQEMLSYVPNRPMRVFCQCPKCYGGSYSGVFTWRIDRPDELTCRYCATVFPNAEHPDNESIRGTNARRRFSPGSAISIASTWHRGFVRRCSLPPG